MSPISTRRRISYSTNEKFPASSTAWKTLSRIIHVTVLTLILTFIMAESLRKPDVLSFEGNVAENWRNFETDFDVFIEAAHSDKDDRTKSYILLNLAGRDAIEKSKSFSYASEIKNDNNEVVTPAESKEQTQVLKLKFKEICNPQGNVIMERHTFNSRNQRDNEPVLNYVADLRILGNTCEYGQLKDELTRDRLVCGIHSDKVRKQLLQRRDLTLHKAVDVCQMEEMAE